MKQFTRIAVISFIFLFTFFPALAQTSSTQMQITALLAQIKQLQAQLMQLQGQTSEQSNCVDLSSDLTLGSTGSDVTSLQNYLIKSGVLSAQYNTGYYGFLTAQAVGKIQMNLSVLTSVTDSSYGITGPKTRAALSCHSPTSVPPVAPAQSSHSLTASCTGTPYNSGTAGTSWHVSASGGTGSYSYQWTLANDNMSTGISGTSADLQQSSLLATYGSTGTKSATVVIRSGSQNVTAGCSATISGPTPTLSNITPSSGSNNTAVMLYGTNLSKATEVDFYHSNGLLGWTVPSSASNISISAYSITITISGAVLGLAGPDVYQAKVVTPSGTSNAKSFTLTAQSSSAPTLTNISPTSGGDHTHVTLSGTNLGNATEVDFYNSSGQLQATIPSTASNISISANSISITIEGGFVGMVDAGIYQVKVLTPNGTSNAESFTLNH